MIGLSQGRLQDRRPLSIIDIGSNSIRLVIYEGIARSPTILFNEKMEELRRELERKIMAAIESENDRVDHAGAAGETGATTLGSR